MLSVEPRVSNSEVNVEFNLAEDPKERTYGETQKI